MLYAFLLGSIPQDWLTNHMWETYDWLLIIHFIHIITGASVSCFKNTSLESHLILGSQHQNIGTLSFLNWLKVPVKQSILWLTSFLVLIPLTPLYPHMSWPLNEFASPVCSLLITSALEVMSLPYSASVTLKHFVDAIVAM